MTEDITVESPCISVCAMDDATGLCIGCYRSREEIKGWWDLDNTNKQKIIDNAADRQEAVFD